MHIIRHSIVVLIWSLMATACISQASDSTKTNQRRAIFATSFGYGYTISKADFANRFGNHLHFDLQADFKTYSNYFFGAKFQYHFGNNVKEDVLSHLRLPGGKILGEDGFGTDVFLRLRGIYGGMYVGKIFGSSTSNSGFGVAIGGGLLAHWIKLEDNLLTVIQLKDPYHVGYDRLCRGMALTQSLSYRYISSHNALNFEAALEVMEGFTKQIRTENYNQSPVDNSKRMDLLVNLTFKWFLPLYKSGLRGETIYY